MERNEELRNDEIKRAEELRDAELRGADERPAGYTSSDSLVRDDSLVTRRETDTLGDRTVRANNGSVVRHDHEPTVGDQVGEAAGGIGGVLAGAAIGSIGGPIGTVIGGIAGAIGGWWTGRAIAEAASNFSHADDEHFRTDYEKRVAGVATNTDRSYERVRPAYQLGYLASRNPEYAGRAFEDIEPHLERGWTGNEAVDGTDWNEMRDYARTAYVRGAASQSSLTGDPSAKNSVSSTGTHGSVGTGADVPESEPAGTMDQYGHRTAMTSRPSDDPNDLTNDSPRASSGRSSIADDVESRLTSPKGSSFTRQGDVPLNRSATDGAGASRTHGYDNQQSRQRDIQSSDANRGPSFTDPVAGEGVENIGSSGLAPRGEDGALNETPADDTLRNEGEDRSERY